MTGRADVRAMLYIYFLYSLDGIKKFQECGRGQQDAKVDKIGPAFPLDPFSAESLVIKWPQMIPILLYQRQGGGGHCRCFCQGLAVRVEVRTHVNIQCVMVSTSCISLRFELRPDSNRFCRPSRQAFS